MAPEIEICGRKIGPAYPPLVIAEIGINHEGELDKALQMVDDAAAAGCECVKLQYHVLSDEMIPAARTVIPGNAQESIYDIMERCWLSDEEHREIKARVESRGMIYLCTPFSRAAAIKLAEMEVGAFKIGSGECNNYPLVAHVAAYNKPVILSTGMNDVASITPAVDILRTARVPYALLHCVSLYPTPADKVNLGAIPMLTEAFPDAVIGFSDHSIGNYACFAAAALGASILERHFTSDIAWPGPDIDISNTPESLEELIGAVSDIHRMIGGGKTILPEEQPTIDFAYSCVVSIRDIAKGETLDGDNIWVKRPGTGEIKAAHFESVLGRRARYDIKKDTQLRWRDLA